MRLFLVLFAVVAATLASPQGRILGGQTAAEGQFPHQVSVRDFQSHHLCGGWIYSTKWIVTAAHCTYGRTISNTIIVVGTNTLSEGGHEYELSRIMNHPDFSAAMHHNIALLEVLYEIDLYPNIRPIPMATEYMERPTTAVVSGWGQVTDPGNFSDRLQWVSQSTLTNVNCRARHSVVFRDYINESKICTDNVERVGMCTGDAGNALIAGGVVIGTASWGYGGCGAGYPDVYTRMSHYAAWVQGIVRSN